jgi:threonine dehydratase
MPQTTQIKVEACAAWRSGVLIGDGYGDAQAHCDTLITQNGMTFIHPFDDPLVIAGQGTIGDEILRHAQDSVSAVFVPVGGGCLISGIAGYRELPVAMYPNVAPPQISVTTVYPGASADVIAERGARRHFRRGGGA